MIDLPPPPPPPPDDPPRADGDAVREGCYIELGGAGGHPDFLRRVRGVDVDADADADADAGGGPVATDEVYAFNLPSVRVGGFLKGKFPRASLRGRVTVTCEKTATEATIDFRRRRVGGCVRRGGEARSLLLGASGGNAYASTVSSSNTTADDDADGGGCREEVKVRAIKTASTARRGGGGGGGVSIARGLRNPRAMTCARLWHAIADATHGARLGALGDSARARVVRPLAPPAAVVQRGEGCGLLGQLSGAFYTLVPIRPRSRGERRFLRTFAVVSLRPPLGLNPRPRRLSTPTDAFQLHPDVITRERWRRWRSWACTSRGGYRAS